MLHTSVPLGPSTHGDGCTHQSSLLSSLAVNGREVQ
jgi:hypothetical protein